MATNVKNNHSARLVIGGVIIAPGATAAVPRWNSVKETAPIKHLLEGKFIEATGTSATDTDGGLPGTSSDTDAQGGDEKDKLIAELATFGIERTKRTSVEKLREELTQAQAAKNGGGLPGTTSAQGGGLPGTTTGN